MERWLNNVFIPSNIVENFVNYFRGSSILKTKIIQWKKRSISVNKKKKKTYIRIRCRLFWSRSTVNAVFLLRICVSNIHWKNATKNESLIKTELWNFFHSILINIYWNWIYWIYWTKNVSRFDSPTKKGASLTYSHFSAQVSSHSLLTAGIFHLIAAVYFLPWVFAQIRCVFLYTSAFVDFANVFWHLKWNPH